MTIAGFTVDNAVDGGRVIILDVARVEVLIAAGEGDAAVGLDAVAAEVVDGQRTAGHVEVAAVLILMVEGLSGGDGVFQLHLDAVVLHIFDVHFAAGDHTILLTVDAVFLRAGHVDGAVLHRHVLLTVDGMSVAAAHVQCTFADELRMPLAMEAALRRDVCRAVLQGVYRVGGHAHLDALAVLDMHCRTVGVRQCQSV